MDDDELTEGALTAEDILTFGPVVEAEVWTTAWIQEARAPIAVAAGRPKLGKVFDDRGVGKAVLIRPCISRGRRVRGLSPIYTPTMLESNAGVFTGWPQYLDHVPAELAETMAKRGRSVKELAGQVLRSYYGKGFVQEDDEVYGYQPGAVLGEVWANPVVRGLVGENPNALHMSISAWPTAGKPGKVPWKPAMKGMVIEGIRKQPQGSVDYVPRGGAGGKPLLAEGADPDEQAWPTPAWADDDRALVVSLVESTYASQPMGTNANEGAPVQPDFSKMTPAEFGAWVRENQGHLAPALSEGAPAPEPKGAAALTEADVQRIVAAAIPKAPSQEEVTAGLQEQMDEKIAERDEQRHFASVAAEMIRVAEGIPATWKADLTARYAMTPAGPPTALLVEGEDGQEPIEALREQVSADLDHARDLIAEATGKPRVTGEGGGTRQAAGDQRTQREGGGGNKLTEGEVPYWRQSFADMGIVESADKALAIHGVDKVEG